MTALDSELEEGYVSSFRNRWFENGLLRHLDIHATTLFLPEDSEAFSSWHARYLRQIMGASLGLKRFEIEGPGLLGNFFTDDALGNELMNRENYTIPTWGEGDKLGLRAVGASNNCD